MAEIGVKELKARASAVIDEVEGGAAYVVTKRGRPAAVLLPIEDAEDPILGHADEYVRTRRAARAAHAKEHHDEPAGPRLTPFEVENSPAA